MVLDVNWSSGDGSGVHGRKLSTVVPASVTGDNVVHELSGADLAMKMHYLRSVYYFRGGDAILGLGVMVLKEPMFPWLDIYNPAAGRVRRSAAGRPHIKCNDSGVRIIEGNCDYTVEEWLEMKDPARHRQLVSDNVLGPDLHFSPTMLIQFTRFKCGGMAVGFSWAHLLGDPVSATNCINLWAQLLGGKAPHNKYRISDVDNPKEKPQKTFPNAVKTLSVKQVEPAEDHWLAPNDCKLATFSFHITEAKLKHLQSKISSKASPFAAISSIIWQCLARIRVHNQPNLVTICRNDTSKERSGILSNEHTISAVSSKHSPAETDLSELAMLIEKQAVDEKKAIEELVDGETGKPDLIVYGANLTFVDMQGVDLYGLELKGQKPVLVDYNIDGVGDEGAVLVLPGNEETKRVVKLILPDDQMEQLREMLQHEWDIA